MIPLSRKSITLIPLQKERRRKELEREKREKEAEEVAQKAKETAKEETSKPTEGATTAPVQTKVIPVPPPVQESSSDDGNDNDENIPPVAGSSGWINVNESSSPSTSSPASTA